MRRVSSVKVLLLLALLTLAIPASALAAGPMLTVGYLPPATTEDSIIIRGIAPRGQIVDLSVNGELQVRVIANATADVYHYSVDLAPGDNLLTALLEGTDQAVSAHVVRTTVSFNDITNHWAQKDIELLATLGVINGIGGGAFGPDRQLTRAQFAKIIVLGLGLKTAATDSVPAFADEKSIPAWAQEDVTTAVAKGLLKGYGDDSFRPSAPVTRAEMAVIAARALRLLGITADPARTPMTFSDQAAIPAWAQADVDLAIGAGAIESYWGTAFRASQPGTRAEAAALVRRIWSLKNGVS